MASSRVSANVVWSWICKTAGNTAIPYPPFISRELEEAYQSGHSSYTSTIDNTISVCFTSMKQINKGRGSSCTIQRTLLTLSSSPPIMAYWEWDSGHREGYLPYIIQATIDIEIGYTNKLSFKDLSYSNCRIPYTVDYNGMQQCRHGYGTKRNIRRVPLGTPLQELLSEGRPKVTISSCYTSPASSLLSTSPSSSTSSSSSSSAKRKPITTSTVKPSLMASSNYITPSLSSSTFPSSSKRPSTTSSAISTSKSPLMTSSTAAASSRPVTRSRTRGEKGPAARVITSTSAVVKESVKREDELQSVLGPVSKFVKRITVLNFGDDGLCPICMNKLSEESGFEDDETSLAPPTSSSSGSFGSCDVCKLKNCGHMIHTPCLIMYSKNSSEVKGCIRCPTCKEIHGIHTGDMPSTGSMTVTTRNYSLPGHQRYDTFEIVYNFRPGTQNGVHYRANGFPRTCYVPASPKGKKVLKLLKIAWERRLIFTIGTSVTTGATNTIVWNEIHHKTEAGSNLSGHGYPDEHYLDNVLGELASQGVIEEEEEGRERRRKGRRGEVEEGHSSDSDL